MSRIRHAVPGDASAIAGIWNPVIRDSLATFNAVEKTPDEVANLLAARAASGYPWLVTEAPGGRLLGFATCGQFREGVGYARTMEHTILLAPDAVGRGLGTALLSELARLAAVRGARSLIGAISAENPRAVAFHAREGFVEVGRIPEAGWKFGRWLDLVLMRRRL